MKTLKFTSIVVAILCIPVVSVTAIQLKNQIKDLNCKRYFEYEDLEGNLGSSQYCFDKGGYKICRNIKKVKQVKTYQEKISC